MSGQEFPRDGGSGANAFEETLATLLRALSIGTYLVGDKLPPERDLASELKVSRATLRVALQELRAAGIVKVTRGRYGGTEVVRLPSEHAPGAAPMTDEDLDDALRFRELLERESARLAAAAALTAAQRRRLDDLRRACADAPLDQYRAYDSRFHIAIAELAGIPSLTRAITENRAQVNAMLDRIPMMAANLGHANEQHSALTDAILGGDTDRAAALAADHARGTETILRGFLEREQR
ncbi:MAG TPA: FCD domain-containing protein [Brevibacterium sp.]|nr:FCD domain-containing protein [Brevibacterium sp.]